MAKHIFFALSYFKSRCPDHTAKFYGFRSIKSEIKYIVDFFSRFGWMCSAYLNLNPAEIRVFLNEFYGFEAPEKNKSTARWGGGLPTCLRNRRFHRPSWSKMHLK